MNHTKQTERLAGDLLRNASLTLAVAESCTGGLLGSTLTDVPGSSDYLLGGIIAYHDSIKTGILGVSPYVITEHGAVSAESALFMARGARRLTGSDLAISVTGIAGPGGATPTKPVGTTYIGIVAPDFERVEHFCWSGDRIYNKQQSVQAALQMLVDYLSNPTVETQLSTTEIGAS